MVIRQLIKYLQKLKLFSSMKILVYDASSQGEAWLGMFANETVTTINIPHAKNSRPAWDEGLQALNVKTSELSSFDLFAVNIGPGTSYTAIRASVTFFKALAHALNKPLSGISSEMLEGNRKGSGNGEISLYWLYQHSESGIDVKDTRGADNPDLTFDGLPFSYSKVTWLLESGSIFFNLPDFLSSAINLKILWEK